MYYKCKYFKLYELLPKEIYIDEYFGWDFFDRRLLETIDVVREILNIPLVCNNWHAGGDRNLCGFRDKNCKIGAKNSAHKKGMAADLISPKITASKMRELIKLNKDKLPYNVRIEKWDSNGKEITWLHIDVIDKGVKVYEFRA